MCANRLVVEFDDVTNTCFVVMPFSPLYDEEYQKVIRPAIEAVGLTPVRGDEIYSRQAIVQDIWHSICRARLLVAELSGRNPNVMYEVGLAHAVGKAILLLTRNKEDVPFDLGALRYIYYDTNNPFWGEGLREQLKHQIEAVLGSPTVAEYLDGIEDKTAWPKTPLQPVAPPVVVVTQFDLSGAWNGSWLSMKAQREHTATIVIPERHGSDFTASMVVTYAREAQKTIVQETLVGSVRDTILSLTGVNYAYIERGKSMSYSLDSFSLQISDDAKTLTGEAQLRGGIRQVTFVRQKS